MHGLFSTRVGCRPSDSRASAVTLFACPADACMQMQSSDDWLYQLRIAVGQLHSAVVQPWTSCTVRSCSHGSQNIESSSPCAAACASCCTTSCWDVILGDAGKRQKETKWAQLCPGPAAQCGRAADHPSGGSTNSCRSAMLRFLATSRNHFFTCSGKIYNHGTRDPKGERRTAVHQGDSSGAPQCSSALHPRAGDKPLHSARHERARCIDPPP